MPISRRRFLVFGTGVLASTASPLAQQAAPGRRLLQLGGYPLNAETPLDLLTS